MLFSTKPHLTQINFLEAQGKKQPTKPLLTQLMILEANDHFTALKKRPCKLLHYNTTRVFGGAETNCQFTALKINTALHVVLN